MREVLFIAGSMAAIVLVVALLLKVEPRAIVNSFSRPHVVAPEKAASPEKKEVAQPPRVVRRKPVEVSVAVVDSRVADTAPVAAGARNKAELADPKLPLPQPGEIAVGETKADVASRYGEPTLKATRVEGGDLHQTYVYWPRRQDGDTATVVQLNNDRVVSVRTHSR